MVQFVGLRAAIGALTLAVIVTLIVGVLLKQNIDTSHLGPPVLPSAQYVCNAGATQCTFAKPGESGSSLKECSETCGKLFCGFDETTGYTGVCEKASSGKNVDTTLACADNAACPNAQTTRWACSGTSDANAVACLRSEQTHNGNPCVSKSSLTCEAVYCCEGYNSVKKYVNKGNLPVQCTTTPGKCNIPGVRALYFGPDPEIAGKCTSVETTVQPRNGFSTFIQEGCNNATSNVYKATVTADQIVSSDKDLPKNKNFCIYGIGDSSASISNPYLNPLSTKPVNWQPIGVGSDGWACDDLGEVLNSGWCWVPPSTPESPQCKTRCPDVATCIGSCEFQENVVNCVGGETPKPPVPQPTQCGEDNCPFAYVPHPEVGGWGQCTQNPLECSCTNYASPKTTTPSCDGIVVNGVCVSKCTDLPCSTSALISNLCISDDMVSVGDGVASVCANWESGGWGCKCTPTVVEGPCSSPTQKYDFQGADGGACKAKGCVGCTLVAAPAHPVCSKSVTGWATDNPIPCERIFVNDVDANMMICPTGGDCVSGDNPASQGTPLARLVQACNSNDCYDKFFSVCVSDPNVRCQPASEVLQHMGKSETGVCRFYNTYPALWNTDNAEAMGFLQAACKSVDAPLAFNADTCQNPNVCPAPT